MSGIDPRFTPRIDVPTTNPTGTEQAPVALPDASTLKKHRSLEADLDTLMGGMSSGSAQAQKDAPDPGKETPTRRKAETVDVPMIDPSAFYNARTAALAKQ